MLPNGPFVVRSFLFGKYMPDLLFRLVLTILLLFLVMRFAG